MTIYNIENAVFEFFEEYYLFFQNLRKIVIIKKVKIFVN